MSEESTTTEAAATETTGTVETDWQAEAEKWKTLARKNEERAKSNATAAKELEKVRTAAMTEQEKAVAEAEQRGRTAALADAESARVELRVWRTAAKLGADPERLLDSRRFADAVNDLPDEDFDNQLEALIKKWAGDYPAPQRTPDFDGGARTSASKPTNMNDLIRRQAGLG
jgi:hypothetical protein